MDVPPSSRVVPFAPDVGQSVDEADVRALVDAYRRLSPFDRHVVLYWARRYACDLPRQKRQLFGN